VRSIEFAKYEVPNLKVISDTSGGELTSNGGGNVAPPKISIYYYHPDHLGTNTMVTDMVGNIYQYFLNLPFGETMAEQLSSGYFQSPYKFNGKEQDPETGLYYYGARYYDPMTSLWLSVDPLCEKYYWISPYVYCLNNPVRLIDPDGREIWIEHRKGFLGLGGKETLKYNNGNLYKDGSAYTGKVNGFLRGTINAISDLNKTKEGASLVTELQSSSNVFTIQSGGENHFVPDNSQKAGANLSEVQAVTGDTKGSNGSGGTIFWNSSSTNGGFDLSGGTTRPAFIGLGHEMGHGFDANQGLLYFDNDYTNLLTGIQYQSTYKSLLKSEWRAVYYENLIRRQAGIPLRTNYGIDMTTGTPLPSGPRLLDSANQPINYP